MNSGILTFCLHLDLPQSSKKYTKELKFLPLNLLFYQTAPTLCILHILSGAYIQNLLRAPTGFFLRGSTTSQSRQAA